MWKCRLCKAGVKAQTQLTPVHHRYPYPAMTRPHRPVSSSVPASQTRIQQHHGLTDPIQQQHGPQDPYSAVSRPHGPYPAVPLPHRSISSRVMASQSLSSSVTASQTRILSTTASQTHIQLCHSLTSPYQIAPLSHRPVCSSITNPHRPIFSNITTFTGHRLRPTMSYLSIRRKDLHI